MRRRVLRQFEELGVDRVLGCCDTGALTEHVDVQERVGAKTVGAVHRDAGHLTRGEQAGDHVGVVAQYLRGDVGGDTAHGVMRRRVDRHRLGVGLHAEVGACELGDVREFGVNVRRLKVGQVKKHVVLVGTGASTFAYLVRHGARHDVTGSEVLDGGGVPLHEPLAGGVAQDGALTTSGFGQQNAETSEACRMELEELHVFQRNPAAVGNGHTVTRQRVRVRGGLVDLPGAAGGKHDGLTADHVDLAGGQFVGHHADGGDVLIGGRIARKEQVEDVELVEELDVLLDALLVERLKNHVAGAVCGVARAAHGGLTVIAGVTTEPALIDLALGGAVERQPHLLQVEHRVDGFLRHDLGGVLVHQVVATLDGVECVPLPVVFLHVGERGAHAALRCSGVGAGGVELGDDGGACPSGGLKGRAHSGATGSHDHDVVAVRLHVYFLS